MTLLKTPITQMQADTPPFDLTTILQEAARLAGEHDCEVRVSPKGAITIKPHNSEDASPAAIRMRRMRAKQREHVTPVTPVTHDVTVTSSPSPSLPPSPPFPTPLSSAPTHTPTPVRTARARKEPLPVDDETWLLSLEADKTYAGIDIRRELGKMQRWCETKRKQPSRARFVNWLNNADRTMSLPGMPAKPTRPADQSDVKAESMKFL